MFQGKDKDHPYGGTRYFTGVVEDRINDPLKLGRVKVRIHGIHTEDKQVNKETGRGFLTEDLPWAMVMQPTTSAGMDGIGLSPSGLVEGTHVVGLARDGRLMNDLIIIGVIGGMPIDPPYTGDKQPKDEQEIGFQDPREESDIENSPRKYNKINDRDSGYEGSKIPQGRYPQEKFLNEPDVNRLARNEKTDDTLIEEKSSGKLRYGPEGEADDDLRKKQVGLPAVTGDWDEFSSFYGAQYPYNKVLETESGHVIEYDDTPGAERLHWWHRWGTYKEIGPKGDTQNKIVGDNFTIVMKDNKLYVEGNCDISAKGQVNLYSEEGGVNIVSNGDPIEITSAKSIKITSPLTDFIGVVKVNGKKVLTA